MIAHLYCIPSCFANTADKIVLHARELSQYPGTWLHAQLELPDGFAVDESEYGDYIVLPSGEKVWKVYPGHSLEIDGTAYVGKVYIYDRNGHTAFSQSVRWR